MTTVLLAQTNYLSAYIATACSEITHTNLKFTGKEIFLTVIIAL